MELTFVGPEHERQVDLKDVGYQPEDSEEDTTRVWNRDNEFTQDVPDDVVLDLIAHTSTAEWAKSDELRELQAEAQPAPGEETTTTVGEMDQNVPDPLAVQQEGTASASSDDDDPDVPAGPSTTSGRSGRTGRGSTRT